MVALLVALSVMGIMMGAALPAWHNLALREKETELVFRGEQYARAIGLYQRRFANAPAPSIDFLVEQRFLRSEEHTSELQSQSNLVCRLLLEKKKKNIKHSK